MAKEKLIGLKVAISERAASALSVLVDEGLPRIKRWPDVPARYPARYPSLAAVVEKMVDGYHDLFTTSRATGAGVVTAARGEKVVTLKVEISEGAAQDLGRLVKKRAKRVGDDPGSRRRVTRRWPPPSEGWSKSFTAHFWRGKRPDSGW